MKDTWQTEEGLSTIKERNLEQNKELEYSQMLNMSGIMMDAT